MDFSTPTLLKLPEGELAYYRFGCGPDVVMVHGWPLSAATFRRMVPLLAKRFTLHLFDLPGTGKSRWNGRIGIAENAVTLRLAIDQLQLGRYALVAHDSGGTTARLIAADDPRVQALVLGNTELPGHVPWQLKLYVWGARSPRLAKLLFSAMRFGPLRRSSLGFGGCFRDPRFVDGDFAELFLRPLLQSPGGQMELVRNFDFGLLDRLPEIHQRITAPVRLIWGTHDPFFPLNKARAMMSQLASADLVELPGAKLFCHEDCADEFAAHTGEFLARHLRSEALNDDLVMQRS